MMLLRSQSISYFNVKRTVWLKGYQNGTHRAVRTTDARNKHCEKLTFAMLISCSRCSDGSFYLA